MSVSFLLLQRRLTGGILYHKEKEQRGERSSWRQYPYAVLIPRIHLAYSLLPKYLGDSSIFLISLISREVSFSVFKAWLWGTRYGREYSAAVPGMFILKGIYFRECFTKCLRRVTVTSYFVDF
jgi:hypothetical protein